MLNERIIAPGPVYALIRRDAVRTELEGPYANAMDLAADLNARYPEAEFWMITEVDLGDLRAKIDELLV